VQIRSRLRLRLALLALLGLIAVAGHAAYAATHSARAAGTGVVVIDTNLAYQGGQAAGTGMVLTKSGEVLTNNHVIAGATQIQVVVPQSGQRYAAHVVGYDKTADVAVLQLSDASNLKTVTTGDASKLGVGDHVTAVGNAQGTGRLTPAEGTVTALNRSITAQDDSGGERLSGLIETDAALQPGDSGGPLLDRSHRVVGMDTAAASGSRFAAYRSTGGGDGFAIPIGRALAIAQRIVSGQGSAEVHVGGTAFLGVEVADSGTGGATVVGVVGGGPAEAAGLVEGDVITAIDGQAVNAADDVGSVIRSRAPHASVTIDYLDATGTPGTASVTLGSGPAQ
jgi:S1-C subfamily serine protease